MVDVRESGLDSWTYALRLLQDVGVGTVPGAAFGPRGEGFLRVTLAASEEAIEDGLTRLTGAFADLTV
jgi:aspartate/methionine/tyrosine aminotransferase